MRRNDPERCTGTLNLLAKLAIEAEAAASSESLLGIEGAAAESYFSRFGNMLKAGGKEFSFADRNRRPQKIPSTPSSPTPTASWSKIY